MICVRLPAQESVRVILDTNHIVCRSYEYHFNHRVGGDENIDRHSNDQCALHYAIRGEKDNYKAYVNGDITLSEDGVCSWNPAINNGQGYIQKKRDKTLIAAEIEALMMENIPEKDFSPPSTPVHLKYIHSENTRIISWDPASDDTKGSWVVGSNIYRNGTFVKMVFGNKFVVKHPPEKQSIYEIRAVNASGVEGVGARFNNFKKSR